MTDGQLEAMKLLAMCSVANVIAVCVTVYSVVKVLATGRSAFLERREPPTAHVATFEGRR